jgi:hypothetical protein
MTGRYDIANFVRKTKHDVHVLEADAELLVSDPVCTKMLLCQIEGVHGCFVRNGERTLIFKLTSVKRNKYLEITQWVLHCTKAGETRPRNSMMLLINRLC